MFMANIRINYKMDCFLQEYKGIMKRQIVDLQYSSKHVNFAENNGCIWAGEPMRSSSKAFW